MLPAAGYVVGALLRAHRLNLKWPLFEAAVVGRTLVSHIGNIERGLVPPDHPVIERLMAAYGVAPADRLAIGDLVADPNPRTCTDRGEGWTGRMAEMERAGKLRIYAGFRVPPVMMTPAYATIPDDAEAALGRGLPDGHPSGHPIELVLDESVVLWRGSIPSIQADQIGHLIQAVESGHAAIRLLPLACVHFPPDGDITEVTLPGSPERAVYLRERICSAEYTVAEPPRILLDRAQDHAHTPEHSLEILRDAQRTWARQAA
ncbi:hypothetical protein CTZ27_24985 [Streptomyces griseocarneus]|nr:hypothetical protein CTZ27_24985 [Streptomyces griseocarneus]